MTALMSNLSRTRGEILATYLPMYIPSFSSVASSPSNVLVAPIVTLSETSRTAREKPFDENSNQHRRHKWVA